MKDRGLEAKILDMAERAGVAGSRIFEVDKSVDSKALNAYVIGFGDTKRIVLYDTLLAQLEPVEVLAVMGHEIGHYVLGHVTRTLLLSSIVTLITLWWVDRAGRWLTRRFARPFGFDRLDDVASVPLLVLLAQLVTLGLMPAILTYTRAQEHEADRFALELTRDNRAAAMAFATMQRENLGVPWHGTLDRLFRASHPSVGERITFCNEYRPWEAGRPLAYGRFFRP
jgi:STE24 endopeptidase